MCYLQPAQFLALPLLSHHPPLTVQHLLTATPCSAFARAATVSLLRGLWLCKREARRGALGGSSSQVGCLVGVACCKKLRHLGLCWNLHRDLDLTRHNHQHLEGRCRSCNSWSLQTVRWKGRFTVPRPLPIAVGGFSTFTGPCSSQESSSSRNSSPLGCWFGVFFAYLKCYFPWAAVSFAVLSSGSLKGHLLLWKQREGLVSIFVPRTQSCAFHLTTGLHLGPFRHGSTCEQVTVQINFSRRTTKHIVVMFFFSLFGKKKKKKKL